MAEEAPVPAKPGLGDRRLLYIAAVVIVFIFIFVMVTVRTCGTRTVGPRYTVIYSNLELKDAANVISRLKELRIPYEIRDEGRSIAVPREKSDQARIGLAEEGLPVGGAVGWEIFDETKLGTTDFDRRIQFIRAISGELARTIIQIAAVDDARVQIVIPETRLFEAAKAPVTASVLLTLKPGKSLTSSQVNGIIHLVASSVENLQLENVTLVDVYGNILAGRGIAVTAPSVVAEKKPEKEEIPVKEYALLEKKEKELKELEERLQKKEKELQKKLSRAELEKVAKPGPLSIEEKALLRLKLKKELEDNLSSNAQTLLNRFYQPNTVLVKVNIETGPPKVEYVPEELTLENLTKKELTLKAKEVISINRITAVVLVDNKVKLTKTLKKDTYQTVAGAIGYSRSRGDTITLRKVPFRHAVALPEKFKPKVKEIVPAKAGVSFKKAIDSVRSLFTKEGMLSSLKALYDRIGKRNLLKVGGIVLALLFALFVFRRVFRRKKKMPKIEKVSREVEYEEGVQGVKEGLEDMAATEPERLVSLLERWLAEEA